MISNWDVSIGDTEHWVSGRRRHVGLVSLTFCVQIYTKSSKKMKLILRPIFRKCSQKWGKYHGGKMTQLRQQHSQFAEKRGKMLPELMQLCSPFAEKRGKMLSKLMQLCSPFAEKMGQNAPKLKQLLRRYISCAEKMGQNAPKINATMFPICEQKGAKCSQN